MVTNSNKLYQFWQELKRRKVFKVVAMYAGAAYVLIELANNVVDPLHLPEWIPTFVILLLVIGFPITIILSWIFDITPEGMKKTESIEEVPEQEPPPLPIKKGLKTSDAIIAVLFVAVCILLYPKIFSQKDFSELRGEDGRISVAVMPFENLTGESSNDVWQNGISEYLINDLASSAELSVVSTQVMQEILGMTNQVSTASISPAHARETAGKLNATAYVSGNFIGSLSNTSILLNLISTENGELVWSSKVVGDLGTHYQEVLDNLAEILRNYLEISVLEDKVGFDLSKAFTKSSEAYRQYINGLSALVISDFQTAESSLIRAVEIDTAFALASFYLAWVYNIGDPSFEDQAYWINRAYSLKHYLPTEYQTWIDLWYAYMNGDSEELHRATNIMESSDIQSRFYWWDLGATYGLLRDFNRALAAFRKVESLNERWEDDWKFRGYYGEFVWALWETGRLDEMDQIAEKALEMNLESWRLVVTMGAKSLLQNDTVAFGIYKELIRKVNRGDVSPEASNVHDIGYMYLLVKEYQTAKAYFRKAYELDPSRNHSHYWMIRSDLLDKRNPEKCLELIDAELDLNPKNLEFLALKGFALHQLDRDEEAYAILIEADQKIKRYNIMLKEDIKDIEFALSQQGGQ